MDSRCENDLHIGNNINNLRNRVMAIIERRNKMTNDVSRILNAYCEMRKEYPDYKTNRDQKIMAALVYGNHVVEIEPTPAEEAFFDFLLPKEEIK